MVITTHGAASIKAQFGDTVLIFNPPSKSSNGKSLRYQADIALVSINHSDMNGTDSISSKKEGELFVIDGPGEYEIGGVFIKGLPSHSEYGGREEINTIYKVVLEGMTLIHLGGLKQNNLSNEVLEEIDSANILFIPIGGNGVLNAPEASKLLVKLSPSLVVPVLFDIGEKDSLKKFLKEEGEEGLKSVDKLTVKKSDLLNKEGEIFVIKSS